ncbi:MAG: hypothetical protein JWO98_1424 [Frankiales bacterium]|nr:hypothetical protein [Frankiales bacterium]
MESTSESTARAVARGDLPRESLPRSMEGLLQVGVSLASGAVVGTVVTLLTPVSPTYGALLGWDIGATIYVVWVWLASHRLDSERTAEASVREDPTRPVTTLILLVAAVFSLVAVIYTIADAHGMSGAAKTFRIVLGIASITSSWFLVHTLFTTLYAREYFVDEDGGINFNMDGPPVWTDFAYLSFTIGMTFQVSDTDIETSALRRLILRQMLISYLFGAVIIAITINLVASATQ